MSVVVAPSYTRLPFEGDVNPALPAGIWGSEDQATGDPSGGVLAVTTLLSSTQQKSGNIFNLEWLHVQTNGNSSELGSIEIIGAAAPLSITPEILFQLRDTAFGSPALEFNLNSLPIFIGWQDRVGTALSLAITIANTDNRVLTVSVGGYLWSPRSRGVIGGPKRPAGTLWGNY